MTALQGLKITIDKLESNVEHGDREEYSQVLSDINSEVDKLILEESKPHVKVICLCGSTKFKDAYAKAERDIALRGAICLTVGLFGHIEGLDMTGEDKVKLDDLHLRKIDMADEILVLNVNGYIGESTKREIAYAAINDKKISYLEEPKK